jgi:hypothetical protein
MTTSTLSAAISITRTSSARSAPARAPRIQAVDARRGRALADADHARAGPSHPGSRCPPSRLGEGLGVGTLRCGSGPAEGQPSAAHPRNLARCPDRRERKRRDGRANPGIRPGIALVGWPTLPHHRGHEAATDRRPGQRHAQSSARKGRHQPQCPALIPFVPCTADAVAVPARLRLRGAAQPSKMRLSLA